MIDEASDLSEARAVVYDVLVVDDQPESCRQLKTLLEGAGYRVTFARDGGQAHASVQMRKPDFVILELILHGESGFEICEWIKQTEKRIPVLILTEIDLDVSRDLAARVGADAYLTKPFDPPSLLASVEKIAQDVWERNRRGRSTEEGRIDFACQVCGKLFHVSLAKGGLSIICPKCGERVVIPRHIEHMTDARGAPPPPAEAAPASAADPLSYVMIRCKHCGTSYHFTSGDQEKSRVCPKCGHVETGALLLAHSPITRAALDSSRRVLVVRTGKRKGKKLLLPESEVVVGRMAGCDIREVHREISRFHCGIRPTSEGLLVRDLGSRTGTFVNNVKIEEETLVGPGDKIRVGPLVLQVAGQKWMTELDPATGQANPTAPPPADTAVTDSGDLIPTFPTKKRSEPKIEVKFTSLAGEAAYIIQRHWEKVRKRGS